MTNRKHKISSRNKFKYNSKQSKLKFQRQTVAQSFKSSYMPFSETYLKRKAQKVENEGIGKKIPKTKKNGGVAVLMSDKIDVKVKLKDIHFLSM